MAYRKTEKVLAQLAAKRESLIDAAVEIIEHDGVEALTVDRVSFETGVSVGGFYKHFPDKIELYNAVVARVIEGDIEALTRAVSPQSDHAKRLYAGLVALYRRFTRRRLRAAMFADVGYCASLQLALRPLITPLADPGANVKPHSAAILGALAGLYETVGQGDGIASFAARFALAGLGIPSRVMVGLARD